MELLTSHKFIAAVVALLVVIFGDRVGLTADQITLAVETLIAYILGRAIATAAPVLKK